MANLAVSLFIAPTPALMLLAYTSGDRGIPVLTGLAVMALCAGAYWAWVLTRRRRAPRPVAAEAGPAGSAGSEAPAAPPSTGTALVLRDPLPPREAEPPRRADPGNRDRAHDVRSFEDLPDPVAEKQGLKPIEILIDRVSDITQVKRLVQDNRVHLVTAWHRNVRETATGDRDYGGWALEADRLLLSASFMTRTLTRHEAIALVTAEVAAIVEAGSTARGAAEAAGHPARAGAPDYAAGQGHAPAPGYQPYGGAPAGAGPADGHARGQGYPDAGYAPAPPHPHDAHLSHPVWPAAPAHADAGPQGWAGGAPAGRPGTDLVAGGGASRARSGVVRMHPQVALRRCSTILECSGWRTHIDQSAATEGIDLFAERAGRVVGLRCVAGEEEVSAETVRRTAQAGAVYGTDLSAVMSPAGFGREARAAAAHAGVILLEDSDLSDLDAFLPDGRVAPGGPGQTAAAE